ncbi:MAG: UvrD-helicase domain-containing protein [Gemmatimonadetes bacterium]|nr:UvrD-helicase domain-containing protein [Gemmatimonadota bacterium]
MTREISPQRGPGARLPDQKARDRIKSDLGANLLVEAGAGAGKTTALTDRMVALIRSGTARIEEVAAVTFTRKAAAELRERFQGALEKELRGCPPGSDASRRMLDALRTIDRAFLGTIHAFCARLLRERPLEAGIDPAFQETPEADMLRLRKRFWHSFLERLVAQEDPILEELAEAGLRPDVLEAAFETVADNPDVRFPADEAPRPGAEEIAVVRRELERLLDRGLRLLPTEEPTAGWDALQKRLRNLRYLRDVRAWNDPQAFLDAVTLLCRTKSYTITQNRWSDSSEGKATAKRFEAEVNAFIGEEGPARSLVSLWFAHRYATAMRLIARAADDLAEHRRRTGQLDFQDLLFLAAQLLRRSSTARRDLGIRYRRLLVDEFQDTDPLQAEVVLLLAAEPTGQDEDWRTVVPREGALFVVGDPKQSIYRFRRADIAVYNLVKRRFEEFGEVLHLVANFRSRQGIADLVNQTFGGQDALFPESATSYQAAFAPLQVLPKENRAPREGVFSYAVDSSGKQRDRCRREAELLATWVAGRLGGSHGRWPGDFLILTRDRRHLDLYARALEEHNVPVDVSGARAGVESELSELLALLGALADPEDTVKTVAVLTGLFFGLDLEQLTEHKLHGGWFGYTADPEGRSEGIEEVRTALSRLWSWWTSAARMPADVLIGKLIAELGILPYAATGPLGGVRAGTVSYALDAVRARAFSGDSSLVGAGEALEAALGWEDAETPLEPGRTDAVRVMNVHRAKGLEAPVVVLTGAESSSTHPVRLHVERPEGGEAIGHLLLQKPQGRRRVDLARPLDWKRREEEERAFEAAERDRLLYVAGTRAQDELVIGRVPGKSNSHWSGFHRALAGVATELELAPGPLPARDAPKIGSEEIARQVAAVREGRRAVGLASYRMESVTTLAKARPAPGGPPADEDPASTDGGPARARPRLVPQARPRAPAGPRGYEWGSVVHAALAAAARGVKGPALRLLCRSLLVEYELPVTEAGDPRYLHDLLELVRKVQGSELWRRALAADERHIEVPFASPYRGPSDVPTTVEGVIDLAFREPDGWVIADYKTDRGDDPDFERRKASYRRQVDIYSECWGELTQEPVKERILLFTASGDSDSW